MCALRSGDGAGQPRVEVLPADELPRRAQGPVLVESTSERSKGGRFAKGALGAVSRRQSVLRQDPPRIQAGSLEGHP